MAEIRVKSEENYELRVNKQKYPIDLKIDSFNKN